MNNFIDKNGQIRNRLNLLAVGWILLGVFQGSSASDLITDYEDWLAKKAKEDLTLERKHFDRGLLKLSCSDKINFEFTNKSRKQVKATCNDEWRRFLKVPKSVVELIVPKSVLVSEKKDEFSKMNFLKTILMNFSDV